MFNKFRLLPFLAGLAVGILTLYFYKPTKEVVKQYPHPKDGADKVYKDPTGTCYTYTTHEVDCASNEGTLKEYPIQG